MTPIRIKVTEHTVDFEPPGQPAIACLYNGQDNHWLEYSYDKSIGMYKYSIAGEDGYFQNGYIGDERLQSLLAKHWLRLGYL